MRACTVGHDSDSGVRFFHFFVLGLWVVNGVRLFFFTQELLWSYSFYT